MAQHQWTDTFLEEQRQMGDPFADTMLTAMVESSGSSEARELFSLLIRRLETPISELPPIAADYLRQTDRLAPDTDMERVRRAQEIFIDHGPKMLLLLYYKSLPLLYACAKGAKVLVKTGRLTRPEADFRTFARRIAETGQFLLAIMQPGGLEVGAEGIRHIQKVRLVHASVRHFLLETDWDQADLGRPINQEDMALTLMTFSITLIEGLEQFGISLSESEKEDWQYAWNAVGRLLGIKEELLPADQMAARQLEEQILRLQARGSEDGILLTKALTDFVDTNLPFHKIKFKAEDFIRYAIGSERAMMLGITPNSSCIGSLLPEVLAALFRSGERLEDRASAKRLELLNHLSLLSLKALLRIFDQYKQRNFHVPDALLKAWL